MKAKEVREKKDADLMKELEKAHEELRKTRFVVTTKDTKKIRELKKTIARIKTELNSRT